MNNTKINCSLTNYLRIAVVLACFSYTFALFYHQGASSIMQYIAYFLMIFCVNAPVVTFVAFTYNKDSVLNLLFTIGICFIQCLWIYKIDSDYGSQGGILIIIVSFLCCILISFLFGLAKVFKFLLETYKARNR